MLARAAKRRLRPNPALHCAASYERLYLPWLCPAYFHSSDGSRGTFNTSAAISRRRRDSKNGTTKSTHRSLATSTGTYVPGAGKSTHDYLTYKLQLDNAASPNDDIPFENLDRADPFSAGRNLSGLSDLQPFDVNNPLVLSVDVDPVRPRLRTFDAIGGDINEIFSLLEACLRVGKIERAGAIIRRLTHLQVLSSDELTRLHVGYVRASVDRIMETQDAEEIKALQKWFEVEIRNRSVPIDPDMIAYMLKASLHTSDRRNQRARLVQRLMDLVPGEGGLEVLSMTDILTVEDLNLITQLLPQYRFPADWIDDGPDSDAQADPLLIKQSEPIVAEELRSVHMKGLGLKSLRQTLSMFSEKPSDFDSEKLTFAEKRARQERLEQDSVQAAVDRWREENRELTKLGLDTSLQTKSLGARMWRWQQALVARLKTELAQIDEIETKEHKSSNDMERCSYGPFLRFLPVEKLSAVTIISIMTFLSSRSGESGMPLSNVIMALGKTVEEESIAEQLRRTKSQGSRKKRSSTLLPNIQNLENAQSRKWATNLSKIRQQRRINISNDLDGGWELQWPRTIRGKVGACLMSCIIETAKIPVSREHPVTGETITQIQPAFSHAHQFRLGKSIGMIMPNKILVAQLQREPVHGLLAKHLPMVVEPEPWTYFNRGGFISQPAKVLRVKMGDVDQRHYAEAAIERGDMQQMFKGLDVLGKTAWRINGPVFKVMTDAWNSGEEVANLPAENPQLEVPSEPATFADPSERRKWMRAVRAVENEKHGLHAVRCFQNFQLEIARAFLNETFYFPHNVDFRGRAYPIPPYLNHMGADHCRGLLMFGQGKELGPNGMKWLRIHLANVFGYDKASLAEREQFSLDHEQDILDSANNPLKGKRWWLNAEDPWQCLAACFEVKSALESGDPSKFVSHLATHQDGTCNGLQHYAALGGDEWGAKQVNLVPGDRPADVYSAVAQLVKEKVSADAKEGHELAKILEDKITRKVVKQTVMTNVYGVTFVGARAQVRKQLNAAYPDLPNEPKVNAGTMSSYIAVKIFDALSTMFKGAHDIQYWLGECANRISTSLTPEQLDRLEEHLRSPQDATKGSKTEAFIADVLQFKSSVIWTSPLRMPVVQPYRASKSKTIVTNLQRINISDPHRSDPVSKRKQLQAFPPNFVHSLDATHMILSALKCDELGLTFAAVHDSFWTHAADVERMNEVLRDAFIRMHSEDIIGRLAAEFGARYKESIYLTKIKPGTKFHKRVLEWRKENQRAMHKAYGLKSVGGHKVAEALLERKRMRLLASSDPQEVQEGKKMVTPGSIFEQMAAEGDLDYTEDVATLGKVTAEYVKTEASQKEDEEPASNTIDPVDTNTDADAYDDESSATEALPDQRDDRFVKAISGSPKGKKAVNYQSAWLPLTFPPLPKKGTFEVSRLRQSDYFFS